MIIHQSEIIHKDGQVIHWARVELEQTHENFPKYLWYRVPEEYADFLSPQSDPFLLTGLLAGMHFGERIHVRGTVSPRLAYQLDEYQYLIHFRITGAAKPVEISYERLAPLQANPISVGSTFSGGVDSLFTLWKHLPRNQSNPDFQITHTIFIMGFDIIQTKAAKYLRLLSSYRKALKKINVELIPVETNATSVIVPRLFLNYYYGPILASCGHLLGGLFKRFFIPSSRDYSMARVRISSSDSLSDALLSSETLDLIHHGAPYLRVEKIAEISNWNLAQENLRVCSRTESESNCSRCEKCVRTMIPLYSMRKLEKFKTFKEPFTNNRDVLRWARKLDADKIYNDEIIPFVKPRKKELIPWLRLAILLGGIRYRLIRMIPGFVKGLLRKYGYFIDAKLEEGAYENLEVISLIYHN